MEPSRYLISSTDPNLLEKPKICQHSSCKRKLGLSNMFICRCQEYYCCTHRNPETHNCSFDHRSYGKEVLQKSIVKIVAPKIDKI